VPWPTPSDYHLAVQDCNQCFQDSELRKCQPVLDHWGMPITCSGNFAVVFCLESNGAHKKAKYAVRCFIRPVTSHQERYRLLSQHLRQHPVPGLVRFRYRPRGICVNSEWYPIVKMVWVDGQTLDKAIESALVTGRMDRLENWIEQWRQLIKQLAEAEIGHGDLQHGNILITEDDRLVLVDYDGIYIPALWNNPPNEVGHPNYQHPNRLAKGYYGPNVDSFSALVIYLSLLALRYDPSLWQEFHDDDRLIFSREDFQNPNATPIWQRLLRLPGEVRDLTARLAEYCHLSPAVLPAPDCIFELPVRTPTDHPESPIIVSPDWNGDHIVPPSTPSHSKGTQSVQTTGTQPWWVDHLPQTTNPSTQNQSPQPSSQSSPPSTPVSSSPQPSAGQPHAVSSISGPVRNPTRTSRPAPNINSAQPESGSTGCAVALILLAVAFVYVLAQWLAR
jgi:hypothetical protein